MSNSTSTFSSLNPDHLLDAVESLGLHPDGRLLALNSFENRVYQIGMEDGPPLIGKFYRAGRWTDAAIIEEHTFARELAEAELPVVAPIAIAGRSLFQHDELRFALFPRFGGRAPQLDSTAVAEQLGRLIARLHQIGSRARFAEREIIKPHVMVLRALDAALASGRVPAHVQARYREAGTRLGEQLQERFDASAPNYLRLHGDCHPGNVLARDTQIYLVDFDDALSGPAIADLWMLFTGDALQQQALLEGYEQFRAFDRSELQLIEPLRLLRQIRHASWVAQRWSDPAFPPAFPYIGEAAFWERHVNDLIEAVD